MLLKPNYRVHRMMRRENKNRTKKRCEIQDNGSSKEADSRALRVQRRSGCFIMI
jgi:hypothetical protein